MVLMHGSGGLQGVPGDNIRKWASIFTGWGGAAVVVDSFGPRKISGTVGSAGALSSWADVADAFAALKVLGADPRIDKTRIGVVGWSRGGFVTLNTVLETVRKSAITDDLKFALHVAFYGSAEIQYRDRATDQSPIMALHGEADNYNGIGPVREFADWSQSKGNPVTFVSYPNTYHDFDVAGTVAAVLKTAEVFTKCDLVTDITTGRIVRMNHQDNPKANADEVRAYLKSCAGRGANLAFNPAARADAVEKVHGLLKQYLQTAG